MVAVIPTKLPAPPPPRSPCLSREVRLMRLRAALRSGPVTVTDLVAALGWKRTLVQGYLDVLRHGHEIDTVRRNFEGPAVYALAARP